MAYAPDFVIIGAPKCGTTSLVTWLTEHPDICFSVPKEPAYFSSDIESVDAIRDEATYARLFDHSAPRQLTGEASTMYLRSQTAVPALLAINPAIRLIVCLRNPIEMMPSVHMQLVFGGREDLTDLNQAWEAQEDRAKGYRLPPYCPEPADLQYGQNCQLGSQVDRLLTKARREQVHFVFTEDLRLKTRETYLATLRFLALSDDGRVEFPTENVRRKPRSAAISSAISKFSRMRRRMFGQGKSTGLGKLVADFNKTSDGKPTALTPKFQEELRRYFAADIRLLGKLTNRDLSSWLS